MTRSRVILSAGLSLLALAACTAAGKSGFQSTTPDPTRVESETVVAGAFDTVWDSLVGQLSSSSFVIESMDKPSRIIAVSFTTDHPEEYIDCGDAYRTHDREGVVEEYRYRIAESSTYKIADSSGPPDYLPLTRHMTRQTGLEGHINLHVAPEASGTRVSVNCKYRFTVTTSGMYTVENVFGAVTQQGEILPSTSTIDFTTGQPGTQIFTSEAESATVTCQSTGRLESEILDMVRLSQN